MIGFVITFFFGLNDCHLFLLFSSLLLFRSVLLLLFIKISFSSFSLIVGNIINIFLLGLISSLIYLLDSIFSYGIIYLSVFLYLYLTLAELFLFLLALIESFSFSFTSLTLSNRLSINILAGSLLITLASLSLRFILYYSYFILSLNNLFIYLLFSFEFINSFLQLFIYFSLNLLSIILILSNILCFIAILTLTFSLNNVILLLNFLSILFLVFLELLRYSIIEFSLLIIIIYSSALILLFIINGLLLLSSLSSLSWNLSLSYFYLNFPLSYDFCFYYLSSYSLSSTLLLSSFYIYLSFTGSYRLIFQSIISINSLSSSYYSLYLLLPYLFLTHGFNILGNHVYHSNLLFVIFIGFYVILYNSSFIWCSQIIWYY